MLRLKAPKKIAVILSAACLLCFLSKVVFDYVAVQEAYSLIVFPYMLFTVIAVPIIYICGMIALLLFLVPLPKMNNGHTFIKKFSLPFSFGFVFLYVIAVIAFALTFFNIGYPIWCWNALQWLCKNPLIFLFVGVLIFMGIHITDEEK